MAYIVYKFRLYPNKEQKVQIDKTIGCARFVYNWAMDERDKAYKEGNGYVSDFSLSPKIKELKSKYEWLKESDAIALIASIKDNGVAYKNFFEKRAAHPKKHKKMSSGSYETQLKKVYFTDINNNRIILPKLGVVKIKAHRFVELDKIKDYVTISRNTIGEYYISIKVLFDDVEEPNCTATNDNTIGVDLGVKDLAICDDGKKFHKFKPDRKTIKRKKRLQRQLARKVGGKKEEKKSNNYKKLEKKIAKIDLKSTRQREYYQYNVVNDIVSKDCTYIGMEDLNVKGMGKKGGNRKKGLNKGIHNAAMGAFKTKLVNKAKSKGKKVVDVDRYYPSSKTCHKCGYVYRQLKLKDRKWVCPECKEQLDRDINASINIKKMAVDTINQIHLSECIGKVKSAESDTKQKEKKRKVSSTSALCETENTFQPIGQSCINQEVTESVLIPMAS